MEFLIVRTDGDWFDLPSATFPEVLHPNSVPSKPVAGWGDYRIEVMECEIAFSYESPGIQIVFEDDNLDETLAQKLVQEICQNITRISGQGGKVIRMS